MSKYRIPTIDEFVPGFEYEWNYKTTTLAILDFSTNPVTTEYIGEDYAHWTTVVVPTKEEIESPFSWFSNWSIDMVKEQLKEGRIRVKI